MPAGLIARRALLIGTTMLVLAGLPARAAETTYKDAVGVPGPFVFAGETYDLSWTSHPLKNLYKQEYLPAGQTAEHYTAMFMLDVTPTGQTVDNGVSGHIQGLEERKASDPLVSYRVIHNDTTGESIIDCVLSDGTGPDIIVEWDAYRYTTVGDGIAVFAISRRAYGNDVEPFLANLVDTRKTDIKALAELELPPITMPE